MLEPPQRWAVWRRLLANRNDTGSDRMILEGLRLMAVGMFTVFAFLALLVGVMKGSAIFFERFADRFPEDAPQESTARQAGNDGEVALALVVAEAYRRGQKV